MKKVTILFALILSLNTLFLAPKALAQTVNAQDDAAYKTSLKEMMAASGSEGSYKAAITQSIKMFKNQKNQVPEEIWNSLEERFMKSAQEDLFNLLLPIYQKHISLPDLKAITAFYLTPAGKRFAEKTPFIVQESMAAGQEWGAKIAEKLVKELLEKGY